MSQRTAKQIRKNVRRLTVKELQKLNITTHDLINAVRETWNWRERLRLAWWLMFGRGKWGGEEEHGTDT